jgi:hypothetical protein
MLRKGLLLSALLLVFEASTPAHAQDASPGAACSTAGAFNRSGGPELSGAGHFMVCSGGVWSSIISYSSTGGAQLANTAALTGDISPAAIAANQNNYAPTGHATASVMRLTASAAYNITGLAGGADGRMLTIMNVGANTITLKNQDAASTAANRFAFGADIALAADKTVGLIYDSTSQRWRAGGLPFDLGGMCTGPSDCPAVGNTCSDGSVFAGCPAGHYERMFTTKCRAGRTWDGSACTGTETTLPWNNGNATGRVNIASSSRIDGEGNTALAIAADSDTLVGGVQPHQAAQYCADLNIHGQTDWYLFSDSEGKAMQMYYTAIGDFGGSAFWTSSEYTNASQAYLTGMSATGGNGLSTKESLQPIRCVRK